MSQGGSWGTKGTMTQAPKHEGTKYHWSVCVSSITCLSGEIDPFGIAVIGAPATLPSSGFLLVLRVSAVQGFSHSIL
ncbi:hypothetical protein JOQ06_012189 [Pogonophryne albipinna]|uniref:Uncharacterized protein n=1 Tax=Pogonophryne albipinna TaxID=1090488 RepID=A0AAD6FNW0_9TELE|nr:hypothetical protein JOQ06_012189 [Pogonophryne albipinna]